MYVPKRLWLRNFMSHKDSEFLFENGKAIMVQGINKSDDGQLSNGSGKSAILEAISVALRGLPLRKVSGKDLVREGQDSLITELHIYNTKQKHTIMIRRTMFSNTKSAELMITVDGEIPKQLNVNGDQKVDVRQGNEWITQTIGVSTEDLLNYFLISKEKHTSFLNMSDTGKKDVIGRFSQSNLVDPVYDVINQKVQALKDTKTNTDYQIGVNNGKIEVYVEERDNNDVEELRLRKSNRLKLINEQKDKLIESIATAQQNKQSTQDRLKQLNDQLDSCPIIDHSGAITQLGQDQKSDRNQLSNLRKELDEVEQLKADVTKAIKGAVHCPKCAHEFSISDDKFDIKSSRESLKEFDSIIKEIEEDIKSTTLRISTYDTKIEKLQSEAAASNKNRYAIKGQIDHITSSLNSINRKITDDQNSIKELDYQVSKIDEYVIQDRSAEYQQKIDEVKKLNDQLNTELQQIEQNIFDQQQWSGVMTKFKTHLANKAIAVIEAHCNEYLGRIKTNLTIQLEGYKINKDGSIRENITATVYRNGIKEGVFDKFSSGEKARIEIAMILSLQKLINMNTSSGGLDLCFLDEVIESVDSNGIEGIMSTLNGLGQTIVVVTHGTFDKNYPYITQVAKVNGISLIN